MRKDRLTVAVDFDGVIMKFTGWKGKFVFDEPVTKIYDDKFGKYMVTAEDLLHMLSKEYRVVILTARPDIAQVWEWLSDHNMSDYVDEVTNVKVPAFAYIDDRAICFNGDFYQTLEQLKTFKPYWQENE